METILSFNEYCDKYGGLNIWYNYIALWNFLKIRSFIFAD